MSLVNIKSGGRFETIASYSRLKKVGPFVYIAGTTAVEPSGKLHAPWDTYLQSMYIFKRIEKYLSEIGAEMRHVVRSRAFLSDMKIGGNGYIKAHGEIFNSIDPVTSAVEAGLTMPGMMVEIEIDALIHDEEGNIKF